MAALLARLGAAPSLVALAIAVALPFVLPSVSLATEVLIFAIATCGSNLLLGHAGLLSFGQGIFFGTGAYAAGLALLHLGVGPLAALGIGALAGAVTAAGVGGLSIRKSGVYFVMLTLAFVQMFFFLALFLKDLTGGENGLLNVPRPPLALFGVTLASLAGSGALYAFVAVLFVLLFWALQRVIASPFGSVVAAIRVNERRAEAMGYDVFVFKLIAFVISGVVTGLAGAAHALFLGFVPLNDIDFEMSERIVIMNIIGGTGSMLGPVLGAGFYIVVGDALSKIWPRWLMLIGFLLIAIVIFLRGGLAGGIVTALGRFGGTRREADSGARHP